MELEKLLASTTSNPEAAAIFGCCTRHATAPIVLGEWNGVHETAESMQFAPSVSPKDSTQAKIWLRMGPGVTTEARSRPVVRSIHHCDKLSQTPPHLIFYEQLDFRQCQYRCTNKQSCPPNKTDLDYAVEQSNFAHRIKQIILDSLDFQSNPSANEDRATGVKPPTIGEPRLEATIAEPRSNACWRVMSTVIFYTVVGPAYSFCACYLWIYQHLLNRILPAPSMFCLSLKYRILELCSWCGATHFLHQQLHRPTKASKLRALAPLRIELYDSMLRVAVDVFLGWCLLWWCLHTVLLALNEGGSSSGSSSNSTCISSMLVRSVHSLGAAANRTMTRQIVWLMHVPVGLKLNSEFGR
jgi:hypothetical protein